jgi:antitoxin (DNA-binding transcriptional repressor) of toxin-antitoxin stability system
MGTISVIEIQQDPGAFLARMEAGEPILVTKGDHPVARVMPVSGHHKFPRPYGLCSGEFQVPDDFDQALPDELLKAFEGR